MRGGDTQYLSEVTRLGVTRLVGSVCAVRIWEQKGRTQKLVISSVGRSGAANEFVELAAPTPLAHPEPINGVGVARESNPAWLRCIFTSYQQRSSFRYCRSAPDPIIAGTKQTPREMTFLRLPLVGPWRVRRG